MICTFIVSSLLVVWFDGKRYLKLDPEEILKLA